MRKKRPDISALPQSQVEDMLDVLTNGLEAQCYQHGHYAMSDSEGRDLTYMGITKDLQKVREYFSHKNLVAMAKTLKYAKFKREHTAQNIEQLEKYFADQKRKIAVGFCVNGVTITTIAIASLTGAMFLLPIAFLSNITNVVLIINRYYWINKHEPSAGFKAWLLNCQEISNRSNEEVQLPGNAEPIPLPKNTEERARQLENSLSMLKDVASERILVERNEDPVMTVSEVITKYSDELRWG